MQKIISFHLFILEIKPILKSIDQTGHNLSKFVLTWKKSGCFIDLLWRYGWQKNNAIWFAENILAHISGRNICQIWDFCRNIANNISFHYRTNLVKINGLMVKPFILQRSIKWIPRISGNLVVKSKLPHPSGSSFPSWTPSIKRGHKVFF